MTILAALAPAGAGAQPAWRPAAVLRPESRLWLDGSSNVNRFRCEADGLHRTIRVGDRSEVWEITGLPELLQRAELGVPVQSLRCGDRRMERDLYRATRAERHPLMRFRLYTFQAPPDAAAAAYTVRAVGALSLAGRENVVTVTARVERQAGGLLRIRGHKRLRMTDFGIEPPRAMLGLIRAHDEIVVRFDLLVDPGFLAAGSALVDGAPVENPQR